ncbi:MAG: hypothetical protein JXR46_13055 [Calditrichaceae bacterium]|nr:hypothetical protein [Calditrichaceae bacterium]
MRSTWEVIKNKKVLYVDGNTVIASHGYDLFVSENDGRSWRFWAKIKDKKYSIFSKIRLISRLLRIEVTDVFVVDKEYYCVGKKGIFKYDKVLSCFTKIFHVERGSRPINVAVDDEGNVYFGEYFSNDKRDFVRIYAMRVRSKCFECIYVFEQNTIRHVHGIYFDKYEKKLWYVTGDKDNECIIGYTCDCFKTVNPVLKGMQRYRAVKLFFYKDFIIYGTDTPNEYNFIYKIDRSTYEVEKIISVEGSVIYGVQIADNCFISTTVEPSKVNLSKKSFLYYSCDGIKWDNMEEFDKDIYSMKYFQFGSVIFPRYGSLSEYLFFYGRALKKIDGKSVRSRISEINK